MGTKKLCFIGKNGLSCSFSQPADMLVCVGAGAKNNALVPDISSRESSQIVYTRVYLPKQKGFSIVWVKGQTVKNDATDTCISIHIHTQDRKYERGKRGVWVLALRGSTQFLYYYFPRRWFLARVAYTKVVNFCFVFVGVG